MKLDDYYEVVLEEDLAKTYNTRKDWKRFVAEEVPADNPASIDMNVKVLLSLTILKEGFMRKILWKNILKKSTYSKPSKQK